MQRVNTILIARTLPAGRRAGQRSNLRRAGRSRFLPSATAAFRAAATILGLGCAFSALAEVEVATVGGGPSQANHNANGHTNGDTFLDSQFDQPRGMARHPGGDLFIADFNNGAVRRVTNPAVAGSVTSTYLSGLSMPVAVVFDGATNLVVLTQGDSRVRRYDPFGNLISSDSFGLVSPTAMAIDGSGNLYVTETGGALKRISSAGVVTFLAGGFIQPQGVAVLDSGLVAVSDTGSHAIRLVNPANGVVTLLTGGNGEGFTDGAPALAKFNQPHHLAKAPNGMLVVADRFNHRVRLVQTSGGMNTITLYGIDSSQWGSPYPGWWDGPASIAEAREPLGVIVTPQGRVYVTEVFWHLLRTATGIDLVTPTDGGGGPGPDPEPVVIPPPAITPDTGYFPGGREIAVTSSHPVFYTTDGSEPTTNSLQVAMSGNIGTILWRDAQRDLTWLRVRAISGTNMSVVTAGRPASISQMGVPRDFTAGIGSTAIIPVVVNLRPADRLMSYQFRAEVVPDGGAPVISAQLRPLAMNPEDFIPVAAPAQGDDVAVFSWGGYLIPGGVRGVAVSAVGTNSNVNIENFAVTVLLAVPIPSSATEGQSYTVRVVAPSGTSDGFDADVPLSAMPARRIVVSNRFYVVGDATPAVWYNAGEFGDGRLLNSDVNAAFYASLGIRVPFPFSDVFDAMDVFPLDEPGSAGGDGEIRFLDWQHTLARSLGLDTDNWRRRWSTGGVRVSESAQIFLSSSSQFASLSEGGHPAPALWNRQGLLGALTVENAAPGSVQTVPVYVKVTEGNSLAGLSFRASVKSDGGAPAISAAAEFLPAPGIPMPLRITDGSDVLCGWSIVPSPAFAPALQSSNLLGWVRFQVPLAAQAGQSYVVRFANVDGAPDMTTQYDLESLPGTVWVASAALAPAAVISDEWKRFYFGSLDSDLAVPEADPDSDGVSNLSEYLAGTDPTNAESVLRILGAELRDDGGQQSLVLRWLASSGRRYVVESRDDPFSGAWNAASGPISGDGQIAEYVVINPNAATRFYRVSVQP